jgi:hypothetical protein
LQAAVFCWNVQPSPSLPAFTILACLHHPPKRRFWWTNCPFAFTIHQNGPFGGWDMEGPPQKAPTFRARIRFHGRIPFEAPGSGTAAMLSLRQFFEKCKK